MRTTVEVDNGYVNITKGRTATSGQYIGVGSRVVRVKRTKWERDVSDNDVGEIIEIRRPIPGLGGIPRARVKWQFGRPTVVQIRYLKEAKT